MICRHDAGGTHGGRGRVGADTRKRGREDARGEGVRESVRRLTIAGGAARLVVLTRGWRGQVARMEGEAELERTRGHTEERMREEKALATREAALRVTLFPHPAPQRPRLVVCVCV